jgi:hypothetical protein
VAESVNVDRRLKVYRTMLEQMHQDIREIPPQTTFESNLKAAFLSMVYSAQLIIDVLLEPS